MKIYKYVIGLVLFAGILSSCNKDNMGGIYTPTAQNISFVSDEAVNITTSASDTEVSIQLLRNVKQGEYTAHYTLVSENEGVFTDLGGGSVTFADGSATAVIPVKLNGMEKGVEYSATLTLSDTDIATADENIGNPTVMTTITVMCDYDWVDAGTCTFTDFTFAGEANPDGVSASGITIENASGTNLYRIVDAYKTVYAGDAEDSGIRFTLNDDGSFDMVKDAAGNVTTVKSGGSVYIFAWVDKYAGTYCYTYNEGNYYEFGSLGIIDGEGYYGGFGFSFKWDK